jgi:hypothetical protein
VCLKKDYGKVASRVGEKFQIKIKFDESII